MRSRPEDIVEALREAAEDEAEITPGLLMTDGTYWEAADLIEWLTAALASIKNGAGDPATIAADALDIAKWRAAGRSEPSPALDEASEAWVRMTTEQMLAKFKKQ